VPLPAPIATELDEPVLDDVMTSDVPAAVTVAPVTVMKAAQLAAVSQLPEMATVCSVPPSTVTIRSSAAAEKSKAVMAAPVYVPLVGPPAPASYPANGSKRPCWTVISYMDFTAH